MPVVIPDFPPSVDGASFRVRPLSPAPSTATDRLRYGCSLRATRKASGLTIGDVARRMNVEASLVSAVELGTAHPWPREEHDLLVSGVLGETTQRSEALWAQAALWTIDRSPRERAIR